MEGYIIANDYEEEICVWHEKEYCRYLLEDKPSTNEEVKEWSKLLKEGHSQR